MARAALNWGLRDLAHRAKVSVDTVVRFEKGAELKERTVEALQQTFERVGLEFADGDRPGVYVRSAELVEAATLSGVSLARGLRPGVQDPGHQRPETTPAAPAKSEQKELWSNPGTRPKKT